MTEGAPDEQRRDGGPASPVSPRSEEAPGPSTDDPSRTSNVVGDLDGESGREESRRRDDGDSEDADDEEEEDDDDEPKLKYARLTQHLSAVYRNGDATSAFFVAGDKMVGRPPHGCMEKTRLTSCLDCRLAQWQYRKTTLGRAVAERSRR